MWLSWPVNYALRSALTVHSIHHAGTNANKQLRAWYPHSHFPGLGLCEKSSGTEREPPAHKEPQCYLLGTSGKRYTVCWKSLTEPRSMSYRGRTSVQSLGHQRPSQRVAQPLLLLPQVLSHFIKRPLNVYRAFLFPRPTSHLLETDPRVSSPGCKLEGSSQYYIHSAASDKMPGQW